MSSSATQVQRFDVKKGVSQKLVSHLNEKSTWQYARNFRFYKGAIQTVKRKIIVHTLVPETPTFVVPSTQSCIVST